MRPKRTQTRVETKGDEASRNTRTRVRGGTVIRFTVARCSTRDPGWWTCGTDQLVLGRRGHCLRIQECRSNMCSSHEPEFGSRGVRWIGGVFTLIGSKRLPKERTELRESTNVPPAGLYRENSAGMFQFVQYVSPVTQIVASAKHNTMCVHIFHAYVTAYRGPRAPWF